MSPDNVKLQSEAFLREHGIEINPTLPVIETLDELRPQPADAVATRAVVLSYVVGLGFGQTGDRMKQPLVDFGILDAASPCERRWLDAGTQHGLYAGSLRDQLRSLATGDGVGKVFRNTESPASLWGGVVKTFRWPVTSLF